MILWFTDPMALGSSKSMILQSYTYLHDPRIRWFSNQMNLVIQVNYKPID